VERKKLTSHHGNSEEVRATSVVEFSTFLTGTTEQIEAIAEAFDRHVKKFYDQCDKVGVSIVRGGGHVRPMTREEALTIVPRKWHLERGGKHACNTVYVSARRLTKDPSKVTCKLCKRICAGRA
jgi:hypothetical protein